MFKNLIIMIIASFLLVACGESSSRPIPKFQKEDIVVSSMNKEITGQVLRVSCPRDRSGCRYWVRFDVKMERAYIEEFEIQFKD